MLSCEMKHRFSECLGKRKRTKVQSKVLAVSVQTES